MFRIICNGRELCCTLHCKDQQRIRPPRAGTCSKNGPRALLVTVAFHPAVQSQRRRGRTNTTKAAHSLNLSRSPTVPKGGHKVNTVALHPITQVWFSHLKGKSRRVSQTRKLQTHPLLSLPMLPQGGRVNIAGLYLCRGSVQQCVSLFSSGKEGQTQDRRRSCDPWSLLVGACRASGAFRQQHRRQRGPNVRVLNANPTHAADLIHLLVTPAA